MILEPIGQVTIAKTTLIQDALGNDALKPTKESLGMSKASENKQTSEMRSLSSDELDEVSGAGFGGWVRDRAGDVASAGRSAGSWTRDRAVDGKNVVRDAYRHLERDAYRNNNIHCGN